MAGLRACEIKPRGRATWGHEGPSRGARGVREARSGGGWLDRLIGPVGLGDGTGVHHPR
jgi:hypothetical protein